MNMHAYMHTYIHTYVHTCREINSVIIYAVKIQDKSIAEVTAAML